MSVERADPVPRSPALRPAGLWGRHRYTLIQVLVPALIVLVWHVTTESGLVRTIILPSPRSILEGLVAAFREGYAGVPIHRHIVASVLRVLVAFSLASAAGTLLGLLMGRYRAVDAAFSVPTEVVRPVPPLGFLPLFILWFGIGELSKVLIIAYYVMLIQTVNTQAGVLGCPEEKIRAARSLGASSRQVFRFVVFPSALPQIMTGLRIGLTASFSILVASELLGGDRGLGFLIQDAATFFRTREVFVGIIFIGALGLVSDRAINALARRIVHWQGKS